MIIFDDVPGGAGHVKRIINENKFEEVLEKTLEIVKRCECGGKEATTSCYGCLRNYFNQYCHDKLSRGLVIDFVNDLIG